MSGKRVEIEVNGKIMVSADVSKARQELDSLNGRGSTIGAGPAPTPHAPTPTIGAAPPTGTPPAPAAPSAAPPSAAPTPTAHNEGQRQWMENTAWRMMQNASVSLSTTRSESDFRRLADRIERATGYATGSGNDELIRQLKALKDAMEEHRKTVAGAGGSGTPPPVPPTPPSGAPPPPAGGGGTPSWLQNAGRWLQGQGGNTAMGGIGRWVGSPAANALFGGGMARMLTGPVGLGLGAVTALNYAFNATANNVKEENAPARNEMLGMADLARQYGSDSNMFFNFRDKYGGTNDRFRKLGYTATQAAHTAAIYDRPGGMMNDTESILGYSRTMGVDESKVASISRTFGIAGIGGLKGGNADDGLRVMKGAVAEGIKAGIAGSDTMNSLVGFAQRNYQEGRSTSTVALASFSQMLARMNNSGSAVMRGEAGANMVQGALNGIGNADPGMEYLMLNAIGAPSAKTVGLKGKEADAYDRLRKASPLEAGRFLLSRVQSGENPGLRGQIMESIDGATGGNPALQMRMYQQAFGWSSQQALGAIANGGAANLFRSDPADLAKRTNGKNIGDDVQGGNKQVAQTLNMRTAEQDREMMRSLGYLKNLEGIEGTLQKVYEEMATIRAYIADGVSGGNPLGANGSQAGQAGQFYTSPNRVAPPNRDVTPRGEGAEGGTGAAATPAGIANASQRTLAAVAHVESTNGTNKDMNAPGRSAAGLFQMQSQWLPKQANGNQGWAAEAGVSMKNPDGSAVTTTAQARAWQLANPVQANQIAVSRLSKIEAQVRAQAQKDGVTLTPAQVAGYVGTIWHSNGGANINPVMRGGKIISDIRYLSAADEGDGISNKQQYEKVSGAYTLPGLQPAATGLPSTGAKTNSGVGKTNLPVGQGAQAEKLESLNDTFQAQVSKALSAWKNQNPKGLIPVINEAVRTNERQQQLYNQGRNGNPGKIVTNAKPGQSAHNHGLAVDLMWRDPTSGKVIPMDDKRSRAAYTAFAKIAQQFGLGWLGSMGDMPHFEAAGFDGIQAGKGILPKGYSSGGYTGSTPRHAVAGVVHGQEFVVNAEQTQRYRPMLEAMNAGQLGGGGEVNINVGGIIHVQATLSPQAVSAIEQRANVFRQDVGQIAHTDLQSHRGPR